MGACWPAAALAGLLLSCCARHAAAPAPGGGALELEAERPLTSAEQGLVAALRGEVGKGEVDHQWVARVEGAPVRIAEGWILDVQDGSAHAGALRFLRIVLSETTASIEWVEGAGQSVYREAPLVTTVRRTTVPRAEIDALLEPCGALATVSVERRPIPGRKSVSGSIPIDRYLRVRLEDARGRAVVDRHFAGYDSAATGARTLPLEVATAGLREYVARIPSWTEAQEAELRGCHLAAAFDANREVMTGDWGWFVEERSLEMLAQAGNRGAIPALEWLAAHAPEETPMDARRTRKIRTLLDDPGRWLEGPPQSLDDALTAGG